MGEIRYKGQVYSGATIGDADYVVYDNTTSGLTSTNVQDALDEIADGGGGGSTGCVELTQAQYDALSDAEQMEDVIYLITDSPDNYLDEVFGDFATVEYTDTASKAYAVGDYLVYDSKFYKVTSAIAQGDAIVPNTNVAKTTVADEFSNASNVDYSNTTSGLTATNVQDALDEIDANITVAPYDTGTDVVSANACTIYSAWGIRYGNLAMLKLELTKNGSVMTSRIGNACTLTQKYRPKAQIMIPVSASTDVNAVLSRVATAIIQTNGNVILDCQMSNDIKQVTMTAMYIV